MSHWAILGHPWLTKHNPNFDWVKGQVMSRGQGCKYFTFQLVSAHEAPDLTGVPA